MAGKGPCDKVVYRCPRPGCERTHRVWAGKSNGGYWNECDECPNVGSGEEDCEYRRGQEMPRDGQKERTCRDCEERILDAAEEKRDEYDYTNFLRALYVMAQYGRQDRAPWMGIDSESSS